MKKKFLLLSSIVFLILMGCDTDGATNDDNGTDGPGEYGDGTGTEQVNPVISPDAIKISGVITTDQTWLSGKTYFIEAHTQVEATITIEAGSIVKINTFSNFIIGTLGGSGKIIANGTADNPIIFTSYRSSMGKGTKTNLKEPDMADWTGIDIKSGGSIFKHCTIEYGGAGIDIHFNDIEILIEDCTFTNNYTGIYSSRYPSVNTSIKRNRFYNNFIPVRINPRYNLDITNKFTSLDGTIKNERQCIKLAWDLVDPILTTPVTLIKRDDIGYLAVYIATRSTFTLEPGVILKMEPAGYIDYYLTSTMVYGAGSAITSEYDDSMGFDIDGFSNTLTSDYYWEGVTLIKDGGKTEYIKRSNFYYSTNSQL